MKETEWIVPYIKEHTRLLIFVILFGLLTAFSAAFLMFTSGFLISKAATRPENLLMIYVPIVLVRTFGITRAVSRYIERLVGHHVVLKILSNMRVRVYELIEPQVLSPFAAWKTGDVLGMLAEDVERLQDIYLKTIFPSLVSLFLYVISILLLGFYSWPFALLMGIYAAVLVFLFPFVSLLVTKAKVQQMKQGRHALYEKLTDAVMGVGDWQFSGRQADFIQEYEQEERKLLLLEQQRNRFTRWRNTFAQTIVVMMIISMLAWAAAASSSGTIAYTLIAAFVLVLFPLIEAFSPLSDAISDIPAYDQSLQRLSTIGTVQIEQKGESAEVLSEACQLELPNVSFQYEESRKTVDDVSLTLRQGEKIALLGPSGSGKSTISKLIQGVLSPTEGTVTLNGIATSNIGTDISTYIAVLNQRPHIFDTTVLNNIRLGNPHATDEEVYWAAKQVKLHDYISSLPNGYHTPVHETGMRFSGGERQRIALARILLQHTPIVMLDEPTIGLDPLTEQQLLTTIFEVLAEKSVLWITHHLALIHKTDRVIFLEKGRIVMQGTHEELLQTSERYHRLYQLDRPF